MYYDKTLKKLMLSGRETVFYARRRLAVAYREEEREEGGDPVLGAFRERRGHCDDAHRRFFARGV